MKIINNVKLNKKLWVYFFIIPQILLAQGSILMVGGGSENYHDWSDEPYGWFVQQADSGKIINIDVDAVSNWLPNYFKWLGASQESYGFQIPNNTTANDSITYYELISASGIFIEGGDQWDYISNWKGTLVEDAIHYVFSNGGAIGGTSAGLAVLGEVVFDAKYGSAYPEYVAYNSYNNRVHFEDDFLNILPDVLTDSHFHSRGRIGRLVPMLARRIKDSGEDLMGIGIDVKTALCVNPDRTAKVYGIGTVSILYKSENSRIVCESGKPVTFTNIHCDQLIHGMEYDLASRSAIDPENYIDPVGNLLPVPVYSSTSLNGSDANSANKAAIVITNLTGSETNAWYGRLGITSGDSAIPQSVVIPKIWNNNDYYENRIIGGMYGVATHPGYVAIYLDNNCTVSISSEGILTTDKIVYILDTYSMTHVGFKQPVNSNHPGMIGAKMHFLGENDCYNLVEHKVVSAINPDEKTTSFIFRLFKNYPNPFNSSTVFSYKLSRYCKVKFQIINLGGKIIKILVNEYQQPGYYFIVWNADEISSGIYFYQLNAERFTKVRKCILLR